MWNKKEGEDQAQNNETGPSPDEAKNDQQTTDDDQDPTDKPPTEDKEGTVKKPELKETPKPRFEQPASNNQTRTVIED